MLDIEYYVGIYSSLQDIYGYFDDIDVEMVNILIEDNQPPSLLEEIKRRYDWSR